jgi:S1-C subfamily serine protease
MQQEPGEQACGSGFVVDASGLIATNAHVVEAALERQQLDKRRGSEPPLQIVLQDGRSFRGEVLSIDR